MKAEEIKNHPVFQIIDQIRNRLTQDDASQIQLDDRDFIFSVISFFESRIKICNPLLLDTNTLNSIQNYFQNTFIEINNFFAYRNYGHINSAKSHLNSIINLANQLPIEYPETKENLSEIIENFQTVVKVEIENFQKSFSEINNKIQPINQNISQIQQSLNQQQTQINNLTANFQNEFNQLKQNLNKQINEEKDNIIKKSNEINNELLNKLDEAKKIVNIIGNIGVAGEYENNAKYHKKQANLFRWIAVLFMLISIIYLGITVYKIGTYEWHISLLRILATAFFIYPAQYAATQSKLHREQEIYNKKMELDLTAINPFIELFDENKKQEIKEKLVEKYFLTLTPHTQKIHICRAFIFKEVSFLPLQYREVGLMVF